MIKIYRYFLPILSLLLIRAGSTSLTVLSTRTPPTILKHFLTTKQGSELSIINHLSALPVTIGVVVNAFSFWFILFPFANIPVAIEVVERPLTLPDIWLCG